MAPEAWLPPAAAGHCLKPCVLPAAAAAALYFLAPPLLGAFGGLFRGYRDDLTPAQALDLLLSDGDSVLIDLRSNREKEGSGIPDVPGSASSRLIELEFATTGEASAAAPQQQPSRRRRQQGGMATARSRLPLPSPAPGTTPCEPLSPI